MTTQLRLELLPELRSGTGLFLRRVRAVLGAGDRSIAVLGAGISTSSETAKEKAVSEALERLTLDPATESMVSEKALTISGTLLRPVYDIAKEAPPRTADSAWAASACHLDLERAVRAGATESAERRHLWEWSAQCEQNGPVVVSQLAPDTSKVAAINNFLAAFPIEIAVSWITSQASLPAVVVLAIRTSGECFYAASAAGAQWHEAVEAALLDIAKILIIEQQLASAAGALSFRRPLAELPGCLRPEVGTRSIVRWPEPCTGHPLLEDATLFGAPWLTRLNRRVVEIPLVLKGAAPKPLEWFR